MILNIQSPKMFQRSSAAVPGHHYSSATPKHVIIPQAHGDFEQDMDSSDMLLTSFITIYNFAFSHWKDIVLIITISYLLVQLFRAGYRYFFRYKKDQGVQTCILLSSILDLEPLRSAISPALRYHSPEGRLFGGTEDVCLDFPTLDVVLRGLPADVDVADVYLDAYRRLALRRQMSEVALVLSESQKLLETKRGRRYPRCHSPTSPPEVLTHKPLTKKSDCSELKSK